MHTTIIDFSAPLPMASGLELNGKQLGNLFTGTLDLATATLEFVLTPQQTANGAEHGTSMPRSLGDMADKRFLGAHLLHAWERNPELIPEEVRRERKNVVAWTLFNDTSDGYTLVRQLSWAGRDPHFADVYLNFGSFQRDSFSAAIAT